MADTDYTAYGILAGNQVIANSGTSTILGDLGSNLSVGGTGSINVSNQTNIGPSISDALINAQGDYTSLGGIPPGTTSAATDIGGMTFTPGVTQFTNIGTVTFGLVSGNNTINLNGSGVYIFQIPNADLTTDATLASVSINLINGAKPTQIFWIISGSLTLGSSGTNVTNFLGAVICQGNITLGNNSTNIGSLCASNTSGNITLNNNKIISNDVQQPRDVTTSNYINIESTLADNQAVTINASNINGGINILAGLGGIDVTTTNAISLNAGAASNFTTTNGNLILNATAGLVNIDGGSGLNIGNANTSTPINIGTSAFTKNITIGNFTSTTSTNVESGTGGFNVNTASGGSVSINSTGAASNLTSNVTSSSQDLTIAVLGATSSRLVLESQGTTADAINLSTNNGGITMTSLGTAGAVSIGTDYSQSGQIKLSAGAGNGGNITLESGSGGIDVNAYNGGVIAIGTFNGSNILIGTAAASNTVTIGNNTGTTAIVLSSGTGGIVIGNDANTGEIQIGNVASDKTIIIGNSNTNSTLIERFGTGGSVVHQEPETALTDASVTLTITQLLTRLFTITPITVTQTLTLPTAANAVSGIANVQVNDSIDFTIINIAGTQSIIVALGDITDTFVGNATVLTGTSSTFRLRFTNVTSGSQAYTVYRIA